MPHTGRTSDGAVRPEDLVSVADRPGPFASLWVERAGTGEWGAQADQAAGADALSALADAGAPDEAGRAISAALDDLDASARGAVVIADSSQVLLVEELPEPPRAQVARWSLLPSLSAVLEHRQSLIRAIVVLADRTGADIVVHGPGGDEFSGSVEGDDHPITKSAPGGWSQSRYQQRAEDSWEQNAGAVAERVGEIATRLSPDLVVIGGDVRAVELVQERLPDELRAMTRTIVPGRAADGSDDQRDDEIVRLTNTAIAEDTVALLQAFQDLGGQAARAANGPAAVLAALQKSQVEVLLVHDDASDERTAWFATEAGMVAMTKDDVTALGGSDPEQARLVDVAIHAALRTGAAIRVVPDAAAIEDGIAAILRWSTD